MTEWILNSLVLLQTAESPATTEHVFIVTVRSLWYAQEALVALKIALMPCVMEEVVTLDFHMADHVMGGAATSSFTKVPSGQAIATEKVAISTEKSILHFEII